MPNHRKPHFTRNRRHKCPHIRIGCHCTQGKRVKSSSRRHPGRRPAGTEHALLHAAMVGALGRRGDVDNVACSWSSRRLRAGRHGRTRCSVREETFGILNAGGRGSIGCTRGQTGFDVLRQRFELLFLHRICGFQELEQADGQIGGHSSCCVQVTHSLRSDTTLRIVKTSRRRSGIGSFELRRSSRCSSSAAQSLAVIVQTLHVLRDNRPSVDFFWPEPSRFGSKVAAFQNTVDNRATKMLVHLLDILRTYTFELLRPLLQPFRKSSRLFHEVLAFE